MAKRVRALESGCMMYITNARGHRFETDGSLLSFLYKGCDVTIKLSTFPVLEWRLGYLR